MTQSRLLRFTQSDDRKLRFNDRHKFAASHALNIYASEAIYSFIPKNACSTMRLSLAIANGCIADLSRIEWIHENNDTFRARLADLARARYTFVILRDPFARLASCFLDKIVAQKRPAQRLRELIGPELNLDAITFAGFVKCLGCPDVLAANIHWRPQSDFLVYDRYDDYFAVENFVAVAPVILNRAGIQVVDARPLTAHGLDRHRLLPSDSDHSTTSVADIAQLKQGGECPHPRSLYTPSLTETVARLFADDLQLYAAKIGPPPHPWTWSGRLNPVQHQMSYSEPADVAGPERIT
jgi:hypothetical protein